MLARLNFCEKIIAPRTAIDKPTRRRDRRGGAIDEGRLAAPVELADDRARYQPPIFDRMIIATSASSEHQARLDRPYGTTRNAASSGPSAEPALPPTWNSDCARP